MTRRPDRMGLPYRPFFYTLDQIADLFQVDASKTSGLVHYDRRSPGICPDDKLLAVNVMPAGEPPEWRVEEVELLRWMRHMGYTASVRTNRLR